VFDAEVTLDEVADAYQAMGDRSRLKVLVRPSAHGLDPSAVNAAFALVLGVSAITPHSEDSHVTAVSRSMVSGADRTGWPLRTEFLCCGRAAARPVAHSGCEVPRNARR